MVNEDSRIDYANNKRSRSWSFHIPIKSIRSWIGEYNVIFIIRKDKNSSR